MAQDYYKHPSNYVWWVERNKLGLSQSTDGETFSGPDTVGLVVRIFCFKKGEVKMLTIDELMLLIPKAKLGYYEDNRMDYYEFTW